MLLACTYDSRRPMLTKSASLAVPSHRADTYRASGKSRSEDTPTISVSGAEGGVTDHVTLNRSETVNGSQVVFLRTISSGQ